jgi:hypothetical protein
MRAHRINGWRGGLFHSSLERIPFDVLAGEAFGLLLSVPA